MFKGRSVIEIMVLIFTLVVAFAIVGLGVLIVVAQFHVLFDAKPLPSGLDNLAAMPARLFGLSMDWAGAETAFAVGLLTIGVMLAWEKFRPQSMRLVPAALIGVLTPVLGGGDAVILAIASRIWLTALEIVSGVVVLALPSSTAA